MPLSARLLLAVPFGVFAVVLPVLADVGPSCRCAGAPLASLATALPILALGTLLARRGAR